MPRKVSNAVHLGTCSIRFMESKARARITRSIGTSANRLLSNGLHRLGEQAPERLKCLVRLPRVTTERPDSSSPQHRPPRITTENSFIINDFRA
jgi:hypothetical protein